MPDLLCLHSAVSLAVSPAAAAANIHHRVSPQPASISLCTHSTLLDIPCLTCGFQTEIKLQSSVINTKLLDLWLGINYLTYLTYGPGDENVFLALRQPKLWTVFLQSFNTVQWVLMVSWYTHTRAGSQPVPSCTVGRVIMMASRTPNAACEHFLCVCLSTLRLSACNWSKSSLLYIYQH